jgi:hypothetical protein
VEYIGYSSQTQDDRLSTAQTTAKVNCKLHSHYLYLLLAQEKLNGEACLCVRTKNYHKRTKLQKKGL